jgi:ERCC4-type nuclease
VDEVTIFVAPSEHDTHIKALADRVSNLPEQYGCDIIWRAQDQWWGIQRKEVKDFFASVQDGRLAVELAQMRGNLAIPLVVIEGRMNWSADDILMHSTYGQTITRQMFHGMLFGITYEGANVFFTDSTKHTAGLVRHLSVWSRKDSHNSMRRRPGAEASSMWGKASNEDWARHLLQGFPGIGPAVADAITRHFGRVPLRWDCEPADLVRIPGIGKVRAKALIEAFGSLETVVGTGSVDG